MVQSSSANIVFVDRPDLIWSFADSITSIVVENKAVCRIEFCAVRWTEPQSGLAASGTRYPVNRIAIPVNLMVELHTRLTNLLAQLEREGAINRAEPQAQSPTIN